MQQPEETTREMIRRIATEEPHWNLTEIAQLVGVSRERVRQIVTEEGLDKLVLRGRRGTTNGVCMRCGEPSSGPNAQFCVPCKGKTEKRKKGWGHPSPRVRTGGVQVPLSAVVVGTISELLAAADLTARGYAVFFPLIRTAKCDLVALDRAGSAQRIEVRSGSRTRAGQLVWLGRPSDVCDRYAVVVHGEPVRYDPPFPGDENEPVP